MNEVFNLNSGSTCPVPCAYMMVDGPLLIGIPASPLIRFSLDTNDLICASLQTFWLTKQAIPHLLMLTPVYRLLISFSLVLFFCTQVIVFTRMKLLAAYVPDSVARRGSSSALCKINFYY